MNKPKLKPKTNTLQHHKDHPEITFSDHLNKMTVELGERVSEKKIVYLDTKYWIMLRDVELGRSTQAAELLKELRSKVKDGLIVCPIGETIFFELLKQSDNTTLLATAKLMDELSGGIAMVIPHQRIKHEIGQFVFSSLDIDHHPAQNLVWTKVTQILGETIPRKTAFNAVDESAIQKAFLDEIWEYSLAEMIGFSNLNRSNYDDAPKAASQINADTIANEENAKNFKVTYEMEFIGCFDLFMDDAIFYSSIAFELKNGQLPELTDAEIADAKQHWQKLISIALEENPNKLAKQLPSIHILAICHAAMRMEKNRNFTGNDLHDIHHAAAAVVYCNAFFTERSMCALLNQGRFKIETEFDTVVEHSIDKALAWLRNL